MLNAQSPPGEEGSFDAGAVVQLGKLWGESTVPVAAVTVPALRQVQMRLSSSMLPSPVDSQLLGTVQIVATVMLAPGASFVVALPMTTASVRVLP